MTPSFEEWAESEIKRLRSEADGIERTLLKWRGSGAPFSAVPQKTNGEHRQPKLPFTSEGKSAHVLQMIRTAGDAGMDLDTLFASMKAKFGNDYKRSSLRAMLFHQQERAKAITRRDSRYFPAQKEPNA